MLNLLVQGLKYMHFTTLVFIYSNHQVIQCGIHIIDLAIMPKQNNILLYTNHKLLYKNFKYYLCNIDLQIF